MGVLMCKHCGKQFEYTKGGTRPLYCSEECRKGGMRSRKSAYRSAHRDELRAQEAAYRESHLDELRAYKVAYRAAHPNEVRAREAVYRTAYPNKVRARNVAYYAAHPDELRARRAAYYVVHQDEMCARSAAYYAAHQDEVCARESAYKAAHPSEVRAYRAAYHVAHPDEVRAYNARRRARLAGNVHEKYSHLAVFERDGWVCYLCKQPVDRMLRKPDPMCKSLDHLVPISKGGPDTFENAKLAHLRCNLVKHTKLIEELKVAI